MKNNNVYSDFNSELSGFSHCLYCRAVHFDCSVDDMVKALFLLWLIKHSPDPYALMDSLSARAMSFLLILLDAEACDCNSCPNNVYCGFNLNDSDLF